MQTVILILLTAVLAGASAYGFMYIRKTQKILLLIRKDRRTDRKGVPYKELDAVYRILEEKDAAPEKARNSERERELLETQMKFVQLQNQINPHFLYNTLENIRARAILDDNEVIADMTEALSRFFRYNISKRESIVKLSEELDNIRTYMHIQLYRFSNKFDFLVYIHDESEILGTMIPKMTLQPIIENAIFHGMERKIGKGRIEIHVESDTDKVFVLVEDDGVGMSSEQLEKLTERLSGKQEDSTDSSRGSHGIAMQNINNRLKLLFGEDYGITVSSTEGVGTEVELVLPRRPEIAQQEEAMR